MPKILAGYSIAAFRFRFLFLASVSLVSSFSQPQPLASMIELELNPPIWPSSVKIVHESLGMEAIRDMLQETQDSWNETGQTFTCDHHFSSRRWALLFAPGTYSGIDLEIGYYVQIAGLGTSPDQVQFVDCDKGPHVPALNRHLRHDQGTCLDTFWRSAENFASHATQGMKWAVSQAAPLRRVHVGKDLYLHDHGAYASGGHVANAKIDGHVYAGGQQQYLMRNVEFQAGASGGAWGMVHVGCTGQVPESSTGNETAPSITVIETPKIRIEKPYVALQNDGTRFELRVPLPLFQPETNVGPLFDGSMEEARDFTSVRVVRSDESPSRIQEALDEGKDVVLAAGIFYLDETLEMKTPNQVLLGLGLASLVAPSNGTPCIHVAPRVAGVRIAGIMLEASETDSNRCSSKGVSTLLEWGDEGVHDPGSKAFPGALFDIFCRVGGATVGRRDAIAVDTMMRIHSGNIVGDNLWLWRADHADLGKNEEANYPHISPIFWQTEQDEYRVETGIEVFGDDVTMYGLAVEHANGHQLSWSGERGSVHFFQCEFPYGVDRSFAEKEFRGYLVNDHVTEHAAYSPGIYSNFRNDDVVVSTAIEHPEKPMIYIVNPFTVKLDNNGGIASIVNGEGGAALTQGKPARMP
jgi:hypothetical protein